MFLQSYNAFNAFFIVFCYILYAEEKQSDSKRQIQYTSRKSKKVSSGNMQKRKNTQTIHRNNQASHIDNVRIDGEEE